MSELTPSPTPAPGPAAGDKARADTLSVPTGTAAAGGAAAADAVPAADAATGAVQEPALRSRKKSGPPGKGGGAAGGMPRRRLREAGDLFADEERFRQPLNLKELHNEIAGELEAVLGGVSTDSLLAAETSRDVRQQAAAGRKQGTVISVRGQDVFVSVPGGRSQGVLSLEQFPEGPPKPGTVVDISIEGYDAANGNLILTRRGAAVHADWSSVTEGMVVEARVVETNKGGLTVDINGIRGFMPISQVDLYRVDKPEDYVNQRLLCIVTEVKPQERNLVVSRRDYLEKQRAEQREKLWAEIAEGKVYTGTVRAVRDFGAFVDLGGVDGLLHVSEITWRRVQDATQLLQPGQTVRVAVLKCDKEQRKISLTLKGLEANPWDTIEERLPLTGMAQGVVTRTTDYGAFVELEPGIEGLVHISELSRSRVWRVTDVVKPGQQVVVKIIGLDKEARRISLSMRQAIPEEAPNTTEEDEADEVVETKPSKPRTTPLRGGIGNQTWLTPLPDEPMT